MVGFGGHRFFGGGAGMRITQPRHDLDADNSQITIDGVRFPLSEVDTVAYGVRPFGHDFIHMTEFFLRLGSQGTSRSFEIAEQGRYQDPTFAECPENWCQLLDLVEYAICDRLAADVTKAVTNGEQVAIGDLRLDGQGMHRTHTRRQGLFSSKTVESTETTRWADVGAMRVDGIELHLSRPQVGPDLVVSLGIDNAVLLPRVVRLMTSDDIQLSDDDLQAAEDVMCRYESAVGGGSDEVWDALYAVGRLGCGDPMEEMGNWLRRWHSDLPIGGPEFCGQAGWR